MPELTRHQRDAAFERLTPDICYRVTERPDWTQPDLEIVQFAVSPDGLGCVWYDTLMEVGEDRGALPVLPIAKKLFEQLREYADNGG